MAIVVCDHAKECGVNNMLAFATCHHSRAVRDGIVGATWHCQFFECGKRTKVVMVEISSEVPNANP